MFARRNSCVAKCAGILLCGLLLWFLLPDFRIQAETIQLNFFTNLTPNAGRFVNTYQPWFDAVEKACNGEVKINNLPADKYKDFATQYKAFFDGEIDLFIINPTSAADQFPLTMVYQIPGAGIRDTKIASFVIWNLYKKFPEIQKEFDQVKVLLAHAYSPMVVASKNKPIRNPKDLAGVKGWLQVVDKDILESAGGVFVPPRPLKIGSQMDDGEIEFSIVGWEGQSAWGVTRAAKYFAEVSAFGGPHFFMTMNNGKWNALPANLQEAIMSVSGDIGSKMFGLGDAVSTSKTKDQLSKTPEKEILPLTQEEQAQWLELVKPFTEKRLKPAEDKGLPARMVFDEMVRLVKEYKE